jgi:aspartate carbamoyltransferase catalytic subunit
VKKVPVLRTKTIVNAFFENSTRTRVSFEFAEKRLSADTVNISTAGSSVAKGETLVDTARNLEAMRIDMVVIRHHASGSAQFLADRIASSVINAGDGKHEHPTQGLLDLMTIRQHRGAIEGLKVCICGDVLHSRVARSNIHGLKTLGAEVAVCGPRTLLPPCVEELGVNVFTRIEDAIAWADVLNVLRLQLERMKVGLPCSLISRANVWTTVSELIERATSIAKHSRVCSSSTHSSFRFVLSASRSCTKSYVHTLLGLGSPGRRTSVPSRRLRPRRRGSCSFSCDQSLRTRFSLSDNHTAIRR